MRKRRKLKHKIDKEVNIWRAERLKADYNQTEEALIASHKREANEQENKAVIAIKKNKKFFHSYARGKSKIKPQIGPFKAEGQTITCARKKAEILREQYESVLSSPKFTTHEVDEFIRDIMDDVQIEIEDVIQSMKELEHVCKWRGWRTVHFT